MNDLELITLLCSKLVNAPEQLNILEVVLDKETTILHVSCAPEDTSRLVGREGKTIQALKTLTRAIWARKGIGAKFMLKEPGGRRCRSGRSE